MHRYPLLGDLIFYGLVIVLLLLYRRLRRSRWRKILGSSLDYHRFHLGMISGDKDKNGKFRELAQALLWAVNKQLADDLTRSKGRGGPVLLRSFLGDKTCVNTCGTVFYESARNYRSIDEMIVKLNDTLISTFYRILLLESMLAPVALIYMDLRLLISFITRPETGTGRLYREMLKESNYKEK